MFSALSKLVGSADAPFPYSIVEGSEPTRLGDSSMWTYYPGTSKKDGSPVAILTLDIESSSEDQVFAAKNAIRRMKTLRHPNFVRFIESAESAMKIQVAMEGVVPLKQFLEETKNPLAMSWGIHQIAKAIDFLVDRKMMHKNICLSSVFVDPSGEWKLAGLELLRAENDAADVVPSLPTPQKYMPPERPGALSRGHVWSLDMWGFGCLVWEVFNGELSRPERLKEVGSIPKALLPPFVKLIGANPKSRPSAKTFLEEARASGKYLDNDFVNAMMFMEEVAIKSKEETALFYSKLPEMLDGFPRAACVKKFIPQLIQAFNFGGAGSSILAPLFKIGKMLPTEEYSKTILPCVIKLFSSTDRATRINLLKQLPQFADHLSSDVVSTEIFPHVSTGFNDSVPAMREATVKSMLLLAPKLSDAILDNQLLRHFAKMQMDEQPEIRTNTTICLGKISPYLTAATRQRVLVTAFARSMKDPFHHARTAGLMAFAATHKFLSTVDVASKIFPVVVPLTLDSDEGVKKQALNLCKSLLSRLEDGPHEAETSSKATSEESSRFTSGWSWATSAFSAVSSSVTSTTEKRESQAQSSHSTKGSNGQLANDEEEDDDEDEDDGDFEDALDDMAAENSKKKSSGVLKLGGGKSRARLKMSAVEDDNGNDGWGSGGDGDGDGDGDGWGSGADESDGSADWGNDEDTWGVSAKPKKESPPPKLTSPLKTSGGKTAEERKAAREARKEARLATKPAKKGMALRGLKKSGLGAVKKD